MISDAADRKGFPIFTKYFIKLFNINIAIALAMQVVIFTCTVFYNEFRIYFVHIMFYLLIKYCIISYVIYIASIVKSISDPSGSKNRIY